jgi:hypothetical protein
MARAAQQLKVIQSTGSPAVDDLNDMIYIPESTSVLPALVELYAMKTKVVFCYMI